MEPYLQFVDIGNAINFASPLSHGLKSMWVVLPVMKRGLKWRSLIGVNHGSLTNMTASSSWSSDSPYCLPGSVAFDGINDHINTGSRAGSQTGLSVHAWIKPTNTTGAEVVASQYTTANAYFQLYINNTGLVGRIHQTTDTVRIGRSCTNGISASWQMVSLTWNGGTSNGSIRLFINGRRADTADDGAGSFSAPAAASIPFLIASQYTTIGGVSAPFAGKVAAVAEYAAWQSDQMVANFFKESKAGFPHLIKRVLPGTYKTPSVGGGFQAAWASRATQIAGVTV